MWWPNSGFLRLNSNSCRNQLQIQKLGKAKGLTIFNTSDFKDFLFTKYSPANDLMILVKFIIKHLENDERFRVVPIKRGRRSEKYIPVILVTKWLS